MVVRQDEAKLEPWWKRLIPDWGGFEKLVAELNQTGSVTVEHDVTLVGRSGAPRQIDVLVRHKQGLYEHLVVIDCKFWKTRISRLHVDALATTVRELHASRGVLFSVAGFESGAITQAQHDNIDLFNIRELTDEEWGLPGRHIDFLITYLQCAFRNLSFPGTYKFGLPTPVNFNFNLGHDSSIWSKTPIQPMEGLDTMEALIMSVVPQVARSLWVPQILFDGAPGERLFWKTANFKLNQTAIASLADGIVFVPEIAFDVGLKISQTRFQFDRGEKYSLMFAVEDCVKGITTAATRDRNEKHTRLVEIINQETCEGEVFKNGSIMTIMIKGFFPFDELNGLANGEFKDNLTG